MTPDKNTAAEKPGAQQGVQPVADSNAPSRVDGAERGPDGRFVSGNQVARQTGIFAVHQPPELLDSADAFAAQVLTDLGGERELSALERAYVAKLRDLEITQQLLMADIAHRGLVTPSGGVRRPFSAFLSAIDRFDRLAQRLGLKRRARKVQSAHELIRPSGARDDGPASDTIGGLD